MDHTLWPSVGETIVNRWGFGVSTMPFWLKQVEPVFFRLFADVIRMESRLIPNGYPSSQWKTSKASLLTDDERLKYQVTTHSLLFSNVILVRSIGWTKQLPWTNADSPRIVFIFSRQRGGAELKLRLNSHQDVSRPVGFDSAKKEH